MTGSLSGNREELHRLVDRLPAEHVIEAVRYMNYLSADAVLLSLLNAPPDDEPYTDEQRRTDAEAEASIARGEGVPNEELMREFGL